MDGCSGYGNAAGHISKVLKGEVVDANWSELHNSQELKWNESLVDQRDGLHFFAYFLFLKYLKRHGNFWQHLEKMKQVDWVMPQELDTIRL